jgi:3'(2'), 5'-bisphosphate nucleotidase
MERELEVAKRLAREAGARILELYRGDTKVEWKGADDPVTAADRAANEHIVNELRRQFPADGILAEETPDDTDRLTKSRVWMIDPMDGTKQFIERIGEFSVMIGLALEGEPQLGVVYQPTADRLYYAAPGIGAFVEEQWTTKRLRVAPITDLTKMTIALSRSHHSPTVDRVCELLDVRAKIRSGSVGLKFGLIADGQAHLYIQPGSRTNQWDTCGPEAVLRAAGGVITDTIGEPLRYNAPEIRNLRGIVASNGVRHAEIVAATASVMRKKVP